jgi:hypothetical protein
MLHMQMNDNRYTKQYLSPTYRIKTSPLPDEIKEQAKPKLATETSRSESGGRMRTGVGYEDGGRIITQLKNSGPEHEYAGLDADTNAALPVARATHRLRLAI